MMKSYRTRLLASSLLVGAAAIAAPAFAQDNTATQTPSGVQTSESAPVNETSAGEIVVTGTLISNPNLIASAPVQVVGQEEIQLRQSNTAEQILRDLPGAVPSIGSAVNNGNGGASFVNLRGLGSNRNVVLLDGQRIVPGDLLGRVDLNNIPLALVERVDALTGGAATTYGADAVAGVVNFITRSDFSGIEAQVSNQITERGDGNTIRADVTVGANFDDGRGNAVFSIGYQQSDPVYQGDRGYSRFNIDSFSGASGGSGTATPARFTNTRPIDPLTGLPSVDGAVANGGQRQIDPATGRAIANYQSFNFNPFNIFNTPFERFNMYGAGRYEVSDGIEIYTRGLFSKNRVSTIIAPSGAFGVPVQVNLNNPYLPAALRNQFCARNVSTVAGAYTPLITPAACAAAAQATGPTDPRYRTVATTVNRRASEFGPRISEYTTTIFDYKLGARVGITDSINLDVSGGYGESENNNTQQGYYLNSRVQQALLANNTTTCITETNGCVPLNIFGPDGSITPAMSAFLTANSQVVTKSSLAQARALLTGDFGFSSPFAEDPIGFAAGAEYRRYRASQESDLLSQSGDLGGSGGASPNVSGGFEVYEAYGELIAPIVQNKPFFHSLTVEAGVRYSDYKVFAAGSPSFNTTTWKAGGSWEPTQGLKLRGNYQRAVRAPNISELFSPVNTTLTNLADDPCASFNDRGGRIRANPTGVLRAVCLAQGANAQNIDSIQLPTGGQANSTGGGNINLRPETSNSYTFGVVLQPQQFIPGLSITADYYNIKVKGAVSSPTPGDAIAACFNNLSTTNPACLSIRRNPDTGGLDGLAANTPGLFLTLSNLGRIETAGIDVGVNYRRDLGFAKLNLSFTGNWTDYSRFLADVNSTTALNRDCVGFYSVNCASIQPEFSWNLRTTVSRGAVDFSVLWRHIDAVQQEPDDIVNGSGPAFQGTLANGRVVDFQRIKAFNYFDLATRFGINENVDVTVTVTNLFDKQPPLVGSLVGSTAFNSGNTYPSTYDALGRRYAVAARLKF